MIRLRIDHVVASDVASAFYFFRLARELAGERRYRLAAWAYDAGSLAIDGAIVNSDGGARV